MANTVQKESKVVYLQIGQNYEHLAENKQFDVSEWVEAYPDATIYILFRRPGEDVVAPVQTTLEDGILTWTISNWETGIIGVGFAEIRAIDSTTGLVKKSHVIPCSVEASVTDEDTAPDFPSWIDRMITMNEHLESVYSDFSQELADGIAAIQDEATEQKDDAVAAIQDKGDAVIASIPMSYTDLIEALAGAAYNANRHYDHDEFVWYDNYLWRRRTDSPSIVGPWNEDDWIRAALTAHVTEALWQVESMQNELYNSIAPAWDYYDATASYAVGDYVINRERLYRCISPVSGGGEFDYSKWEVVTVATELQNYVQSSAIAPEYSASSTYTAGQYVWYSGNVYRCTTDISTAEAWTAAHWQLVKVGDELTDLKSALDKSPRISDPIPTDADLYISDSTGNVIAQFKDGHIQTKHFDSSEIVSPETIIDDAAGSADTDKVWSASKTLSEIKAPETIIDDAAGSADTDKVWSASKTLSEIENAGGNDDTEVKDSEATNVDLDVCDSRGNVLVRYKNGAIQTKNFNSDDIVPAIETFSVSGTYRRGVQNSLNMSGDFSKGDEIYFHLADGNRYDAYGRYATYLEGNKIIASNIRGSNGYYRHIVSSDCNSVGITIGGTEYTDGTALTLYVYRKHRDVEPKIVTVKADGTGMFTTIKGAVDSITDANHLTNPYIIEVYPGTYDCLEGYTDEEIASADTGGTYTQDSMVGIKLTDGMSLRGIGRNDDIILTAELSSSEWSSAVRGQISTLNIEGEGNIENVTIVGKNIRYCVHDDFLSPTSSHDKRILRNLKFKGEYLAYYPLFTTYGAGMSSPRDYLIVNCDFGFDLGIHSNGGYKFGCTIEVSNCSGTRFRIGDNATAESDAINRVIVNDCNFQLININHATSGLSNHMKLEGTGDEKTMVNDATADLFRLGMIDIAPTGFATGKMVKRSNTGLTFEVTNDRALAYGVVIGSDSEFSYVLKCGYIPTNYLGFSGLAVGDYLTVDNAGSVVTGGTAENAIAIVKAVYSDVAQAELLF